MSIANELQGLEKIAENRRNNDLLALKSKVLLALLVIVPVSMLVRIFEYENQLMLNVIALIFAVTLIGAVISGLIIVMKDWRKYLKEDELKQL